MMEMTEMTDRRIEPQASSLLVQIYRENWMRDPYRIRCLAAPPYDGWMRLSADLQQQARQRRLAQVSSIAKKVGGVLIKKALHIVTDATDLIYYPFRTWGFILMVRDLLPENY